MKHLHILLMLAVAHVTQAADWVLTTYYPWIYDSENGWYFVPSISEWVWLESEEIWIPNPILGEDYALSYALVSTGQLSAYDDDGLELIGLTEGDAFYGQDAHYLKGISMSYTDNGDGTVVDNSTGLMWQQVPEMEGMTYAEAVEYCENLELAGYDDWRVPNIKELFSISDFSSGWPYIDTTYFDLSSEEVSKDEQYWSTAEYVGVTTEGGDGSVFGVNHVTGHIKAYPGGTGDIPDDSGEPAIVVPPPPGDSGAPTGNPMDKQVRAVRGAEYGINEFVDNQNGTISDLSTGMMWSQADSGEGMDWESALAYAENSELAGYTDWRLPNVKELQSIVDYSYAPGATDPAQEGPAIDPVFSCTPIINEAGADDYGYVWTSTSARFTSGEPYYYAWYVAFGRAVDNDGNDTHGAGAVRFDTKVEGGPAGEGAERIYNFVRLVRDI